MVHRRAGLIETGHKSRLTRKPDKSSIALACPANRTSGINISGSPLGAVEAHRGAGPRHTSASSSEDPHIKGNIRSVSHDDQPRVRALAVLSVEVVDSPSGSYECCEHETVFGNH